MDAPKLKRAVIRMGFLDYTEWCKAMDLNPEDATSERYWDSFVMLANGIARLNNDLLQQILDYKKD